MRYLLVPFALIPSIVLAAPTVTLTATPTTGNSPLSTTLTWSSTEVVTCTASGGWTGSKATSGTQVVSNITANTTFTLNCSAADGSAVLTWVAPTKNTDGTNIPATGTTSLSGYKVYHAATLAGLDTATPTVINNKATLTYTVTGLAAGTRHFGVSATNVAGAESDKAAVNKVITIPAATASASVTVVTVPNPPVLTVSDPVAYTIVKRVNAFALLPVGSVPVGTPCFTEESIKGYYAVPRDQVTWAGTIKPDVVVAKCSEGS